MCHAFKMGANFHQSNSVTFDAKKTKETLMMCLSRNTIIKAKTFVRFEKFAW